MKSFLNIFLILFYSLLANAQSGPELLEQAKNQIDRKQFDEAMITCEKLKQVEVTYQSEGYFLKGVIESEKAFYTLAIEDITQAIDLGYKDPKAYALRGYCLFVLRDYKSSKVDYKDACELDSNNAVYYYNLANVEQKMYKWKDAIYNYTIAIKHNKTYSEAYKNRGFIKMTRGIFVEAIKDYDSALKYNQNDDIILLYRGMALTSIKKYKDAVSMFNRCIRLKEKNGSAYYNRGLVKFHQHDFIGAVLDYDTAIMYKPDMEIAYFNRALCKLELSQKHYTISCDDFRKAAELGYMEALDYLKKYCE